MTDTGQRAHTGNRAPALAEGIELIGEYEGSGFKEPPSIARRADGHVIQLSKLLYQVAAQVDGQRNVEEIAERVSAESGRTVSGENVDYLIKEKLRPLGVLAAEDGSSPEVGENDPLLALKFRTAVVPEGLVNALTTAFHPLFWPVVVIAVLAGLAAVDVWFFLIRGVGEAARQAAYEPVAMLAVLGLVILSAAFHETGHATGCRYGGAKPGVMGVGLYLVWPAFYTNVTDSYRLKRGGRLRTDLGGIYFNTIFVLAVYGLYALTRYEPLLLVILVQHVEILRHFVPFIRLDGYYVMSDLTGVPDLFARLRPILRSMVPGSKRDERVTELKPWVRVVVTGWVLFVVPVLLLNIVLLTIQLPRILATTYDALLIQVDTVRQAAAASDAVGAGVGVFQALILILPVAGIALIFFNLARQLLRGIVKVFREHPVAGTGLATAGLAVAGFIVFTLLPNGDYRPLQEGERLTFGESVSLIRHVRTGRPGLTEERASELGGAPPVYGASESPTAGESPPPAAATPSPSPSASPSPTGPSPSPSPVVTPAPTPTRTASATPRPTRTSSSPAASPQASSATPSPTVSSTEGTTATATPTATSTATSTPTATQVSS